MSKLYIKKTVNIGSNDLETTGNLKDGTYSLTVSEVSNSCIVFGFYLPLLNSKIVFRAPFAFNWTNVIVSSDGTAGEITADIWTDIDANFPPTVADTIFSTAPALAQTSKGTAVTSFVGGKESVAAGDWIFCNIKACLSGSYTSVANNGSGKVRFACSAAHGLTTGDTITITSSVAGYAGVKVVTATSDTTHFDTNDAYSATAAGTFRSAPDNFFVSCNINKT